MTRHLVVVGGGVIGLAIAWQAARQKFAVTLIERGPLGREASWASAGLLPYGNLRTTLDPLDRLAALSYALHAEWYSELKSVSGVEYEYERTGTTHLATSRAEKASLKGIEQQCVEEQVPFQLLSGNELARQIPTMQETVDRADGLAAIHLPNDAQLRSPRFLKALEAAGTKLGTRIIANAGKTALRLRGDRVAEVFTERGECITGDEFVIAAGAWSSELLAPIGLDVGFVPIRGQMVYYQLPSRPFVPCVYDGGNYIVTRRDGGLLAGSTLEDVGFDRSTTIAAIAALRSFAASIVPELMSREPDRVWAGLRPATYDGFPSIGRVPGIDNLLVAAGHFRAGILLAPITALSICQLAEGLKPETDLSSFAPRRRAS